MSNFRPDLKDAREEQEISSHSFYRGAEPYVAEFLGGLRGASSAEDFYELHLGLFRRFLGAQRVLEELAISKKEKRADIRVLKAAGEEEGIRKISTEIAAIEADRRAARAVLSLYRTLGDSLVWALFGYQRSAASVLGEGKRVDRLADVAGLKAELEVIDNAWAEGKLAIHTDITSCLRHGDILTVASWEPRVYELGEVKAGRGTDPAQRERLAQAVTLLNGGFHPSAAGSKALEIVQSPVTYRSHISAAALGLTEARESSFAAMRLEEGLAIEVYDETNPASLTREDFEQADADFEAELGWEADDRIIFSTAARRLRDRAHSFSSLVPLALLPFSIEDAAAILMGRYDIVSILNAAVIEQALGERGIEADVARGDAVGDLFLRAKRGSAAVDVPAMVREQISVELMTISALVEMVDWVLAEMERRGSGEPRMTIDYSDEHDSWTTYQG